jgi:hypothetical protein
MEARVQDFLYRCLTAGLLQTFIWGGELMGEENLPEQGPAVLVSNHLAALGPIAAAACVPRRLYPWVVADMMDEKHAPEYMRWDFVERELGLKKPFSLWLATAISKISVPLLKSVSCIPVYSDAERMHLTFERSVDHFLQDRFVLVFPEDPDRPLDPHFRMRPFKKGFVRLGEVYFERTGRAIRFYPLAAHAERRVVRVGRPITYNPYAPPVAERIRIKSVLEKMIHEMYLETGGSTYIGVPLPH